MHHLPPLPHTACMHAYWKLQHLAKCKKCTNQKIMKRPRRMQAQMRWTSTSGRRRSRRTFQCCWGLPRCGTCPSLATRLVPFCPTARPCPSWPLTFSRHAVCSSCLSACCHTRQSVMHATLIALRQWADRLCWSQCSICHPACHIHHHFPLHQHAHLLAGRASCQQTRLPSGSHYASHLQGATMAPLPAVELF